MKILFLCGGIGKRMYPLEEDKFFFKFIGNELILHHIAHLKAQGFKEEDFVFVGNPSNIGRLKKLCGEDSEYAIQKSPRGMADAVLSAKDLISGKDLLIINPNDVLEPAAYEKILTNSRGRRKDERHHRKTRRRKRTQQSDKYCGSSPPAYR